jgi:hypothetical protein
MAAQNGIGTNAAMYGGNQNVVLTSPGYHSDMQVLMENMEKLSTTLHRNRQEWLQVQDGLARVERLQVSVKIAVFADKIFLNRTNAYILFVCRVEWLGMVNYRRSPMVTHVRGILNSQHQRIRSVVIGWFEFDTLIPYLS